MLQQNDLQWLRLRQQDARVCREFEAQMPILPGSDTKLGGKGGSEIYSKGRSKRSSCHTGNGRQAVQCNDGDHGSAFEYFMKAAGLGDVDAHFCLSSMYEKGIRVGKPHPLFARQHDWGSMFGEGPMPTLTSLMNEEGIDGSTKLTTLMGIGEKEEKKEMYHLEKAAICGHIEARYNIAICEKMHDRIDRAVKHWIIAANLGCDRSIQDLKV
eukprot:scaffold8571_cov125-Skeletonema_marinoi.AAC.3